LFNLIAAKGYFVSFLYSEYRLTTKNGRQDLRLKWSKPPKQKKNPGYAYGLISYTKLLTVWGALQKFIVRRLRVGRLMRVLKHTVVSDKPGSR